MTDALVEDARACESLTDQLFGHYALEADLYVDLLAMAREQGELLRAAGAGDAGAVERCAALFERKERLLRTIARIEQEIAPLKEQWWATHVAPADRQRLNALLDEILETIDALVSREEANERLLGVEPEPDDEPLAKDPVPLRTAPPGGAAAPAPVPTETC
jgi:hypothetical protein